jgi:inosine-uridine nucleoside N-ribohydrolase
MMRIVRRSAAVVAGVLAMSGMLISPAVADPPSEPVKMIFDTDFGGDCDDAGTMAMLNAMIDNGEVELLAVMASNPGTQWAAGGLDAINTYYGHGNIPVGVRDRGSTGERMGNVSGYATPLAQDWPNDTGNGAQAPDATDLYRQVLAAQPDGSVVVVVTGSMSDLPNLMNSTADQYSPLSGLDLVAQKVSRLVVMGAQFPTGQEWNIMLDPDAAADVGARWPTDIFYSGGEVGSAIQTGARLFTEAAPNNPVTKAYEMYVGFGNNRASWDIVTAYWAVRGGEGLISLSPAGRIAFGNDGSNTWTADPTGRQYYQIITGSTTAIARALEDLMVQWPLALRAGTGSIDVWIEVDGIPPDEGELTLTVPVDASVELEEGAQFQGARRFAGTMPQVSVSDTRPVAVGWEVVGKAASFTGPSQLPASALAWDPFLVRGRSGLAAGAATAAAADGGLGLSEPSLLASGADPGRKGTADLGADLELATPVNIQPGTYSTTLTLSLYAVD